MSATFRLAVTKANPELSTSISHNRMELKMERGMRQNMTLQERMQFDAEQKSRDRQIAEARAQSMKRGEVGLKKQIDRFAVQGAKDKENHMHQLNNIKITKHAANELYEGHGRKGAWQPLEWC